jgi:hypothetical protein
VYNTEVVRLKIPVSYWLKNKKPLILAICCFEYNRESRSGDLYASLLRGNSDKGGKEMYKG